MSCTNDPEFEFDQIMYCSLARVPMSSTALQDLVQTASALNRLDHITGMLMYSEGVFLQLFEGPAQAVHELWARLLRDQRHIGIVKLLHQSEVEQRLCADWEMKCVDQTMLPEIVHQLKQEADAQEVTRWLKPLALLDFFLMQPDWQLALDQLQRENLEKKSH